VVQNAAKLQRSWEWRGVFIRDNLAAYPTQEKQIIDVGFPSLPRAVKAPISAEQNPL